MPTDLFREFGGSGALCLGFLDGPCALCLCFLGGPGALCFCAYRMSSLDRVHYVFGERSGMSALCLSTYFSTSFPCFSHKR